MKILKLTLIALLFSCNAYATTITAAAGGGNWTAGGTWVGGNAPTAADDALLTATSGNVTIDSGAVCRSLDCTGYTGTLTHNAGVTFNIGDGTAGTGNNALKLVAGMTYTLNNATTSATGFVSTSATQQTITLGGKVLGNVTFSGAGSSYQFADAWSNGTGSITHTAGTVDTNGKTVTSASVASTGATARTLTFGASALTLSGSTPINFSGSNLTFNANTSDITASSAGLTFTGGGKTFYNFTMTGGGTNPQISGANTFNNFTYTGTAVKTNALLFNADQVISGTLTINGNSATNRVLVSSAVSGTPTQGTSRTLTAATVSVSNADFRDITGAGAGSWNLSAITGNSGDCGGNSGITFTTSASQTWSGTTGGNWSTNAWTSRVPLPQDDVVINKAFSASQTVTMDMPRAGRSIDWTGSTGTPAWAKTTVSSIFGSVTMIAGMTNSGTSGITLEGRSSYNFTSAGQTWTNPLNVQAFGGTVTFQDAFTSSSTLNLYMGTIDLNNFSCSVSGLSNNVSPAATRVLTLGSGTISLTGTSNIWNFVSANQTLNANTSTIKYTNTSNSAVTFGGGGFTYNNLWFSRGASTGSITITGSNTFADFKDDGSVAHSILFTAATTQTVSTFTVSGTAGNLISLDSTTTATYNLVKSGGGQIGRDYIDVQHSVATPSSTWFAGTHSTNDQAVATAGSGWTFTDPAACGAFSGFFTLMDNE